MTNEQKSRLLKMFSGFKFGSDAYPLVITLIDCLSEAEDALEFMTMPLNKNASCAESLLQTIANDDAKGVAALTANSERLEKLIGETE